VLAALSTFFLVELLGLFAGFKECGFDSQALVTLALALMVYAKFPWVLLLIAVTSVSVGLLWPIKPLYRRLVMLLFLLAAIAVSTLSFMVAPHSAVPCTAI